VAVGELGKGFPALPLLYFRGGRSSVHTNTRTYALTTPPQPFLGEVKTSGCRAAFGTTSPCQCQGFVLVHCVPLTNFAGWFLVAYVLYQSFALYMRRQNSGSMRSNDWRLPVLFYALSAAGNLLLLLMPQTAVSDSTGTLWNVRDIAGTCALVSVFTMGAFALLRWTTLLDQEVIRRNE